MQGIFLEKILNMSLIGCYSIVVVCLVRLLLLKCGRKYAYYLWLGGIAGIALFCRDMEISCDEAVLAENGQNLKKQYAEPSVKARIKNVLRFQKKSVAVSVFALICLSGVVLGLACRPSGNDDRADVPQGTDAGTGQEEQGLLYAYDTQTGGSAALFPGTQGGTLAYLGRYGGYLYVARQDKEQLYIDCVKEDDGLVESNLLHQPLDASAIISFYADENYILFSAGSYEGSMGGFHGAFYTYNRSIGSLKKVCLTEAAKFHVVDGYVYYQKTDIPVSTVYDIAEGSWDLNTVTDVQDSFSHMSPNFEPGTEGVSYLLAKTENYTLYGKGDYESMLVSCNGHYAEIPYLYASNYMIPVRVKEADYDGDGVAELSMDLALQCGTGVFVEILLMADFQEDGELAVYRFWQEDYLPQLNAHLTFENTDEGTQAFVDGNKAGKALVCEYEDAETGSIQTEPFASVDIGDQIRFDLDGDRIRIDADLAFWSSDFSGIAWYNDNTISAYLDYQDGGIFALTDFHSRNREAGE